MTIQLRMSTVAAAILATVAIATLATCGKVKEDGDASIDMPGGDQLCVWDQGTWDSCKLGP